MVAERATVFQRAQLGVESTPGTAVAATKQLQSLSFNLAANIETQRIRPEGSKSPTVQTVGREWTNVPISGTPTFDEQIYAWASVLCKPTPTTVTAGVYEWLFSMQNFAADTTATFTIEHGSAERAARAKGVQLTEFGYTLNRTAWTQSGNAVGQEYEDGFGLSVIAQPTNQKNAITMSDVTGGTFTLTIGSVTSGDIPYNATPAQVQTALEGMSNIGAGNVVVTGTALPEGPLVIMFVGKFAATDMGTITADTSDLISDTTPSVSIMQTQAGVRGGFLPVIPMVPSQVDCYFSQTAEGLDYAIPLDYMFELSWKISNRFGQSWPLRSSYKSFQSSVELEPKIDLSFKVKSDSNGMALLNKLRNGETVFFRTVATGPLISGSHTYKFQHDTALKVASIGALSDNGGVYAATFSAEGVYDAGWGKTTEVKIINTTGSL